MEDSILKSIKTVLGVEPDEDDFDLDFIFAINAVFDDLTDLGVGPADGFMIEGDTETWESFYEDGTLSQRVKVYMQLRVRLIFDPPSTSYHIQAIEKQIEKLEWRIHVQREEETWVSSQAPLVVVP